MREGPRQGPAGRLDVELHEAAQATLPQGRSKEKSINHPRRNRQKTITQAGTKWTPPPSTKPTSKSMGAIVGPFVLNTMEDRTIVCTEEEISAAGKERGRGKNRRLDPSATMLDESSLHLTLGGMAFPE